jgi:anti-sigma B factor antagonist
MQEAHASRPRSRFEVRRTGDGRYDLAGELDISTAGVLEDVLDREPARELTLDTTDLRFVDSSGVRVFLRVVVRGCSLTVRSPTRIVERTRRMAGVDRLPGVQIVP